MHKKLSEMTLEELWKLFPISLEEHKDYWKLFFEEEKKQLMGFLPSDAIIHHIGSTAINGIYAKPIIDILVEVNDNLVEIAQIIENNGWIKMAENKIRISFNKGYTENGFAEKVYHLHLRLYGDNDEIYFRDYLNMHPDIAKEYENLKLELLKKYKYDRDGYTLAKSKFIHKYTALAKQASINK